MKYIIFILLITSLVSKAQSPVKEAIPMEYWGGYQGSDNNLYAIYGGTITQLTLPSSRLIQKAAGCFNLFRITATDGSIWQSNQYNQGLGWTQITTDSTGATINNAGGWINGYADNYVFIKTDSSLWFGGADDPGIFHSSGSVFMRPYKMTTTSAKFRKAIICARGVYAVSSDSTQLYYWGPGAGTTPTTIYTFSGQGTGKIIDFACSNGNAFTSATFAIIQRTFGSPYGHPYALGQGYGFWGSSVSQNFTTFTDLYTQWGLTSLVKEINVNFQTTVFLDSAGNMGALGWNVQGEVGNGIEFVNRYTYVNWPNYGWDGQGGENVVFGVQWINGGTKFVDVWSNLFFTYWHVAKDISGNLWYWGRNKTQVMAYPYYLSFSGSPSPNEAQTNGLDVLSPTMRDPFSITSSKVLNWQVPTISTTNQNISTTTTTLTVGGHPALAINSANSTDTINYRPSTYSWSQTSGPAGAHIVSPTSKTTSVTGLTNGVFLFDIITVDNNTAINHATLQVTVSGVNSSYIPFPLGNKIIAQ